MPTADESVVMKYSHKTWVIAFLTGICISCEVEWYTIIVNAQALFT